MEASQAIATVPEPVIIEAQKRFSQSLLWQLQRQFFELQGIQAWQQGTVPHYVTSNTHIANAYAQVLLGFLRDCHRTPSDLPTIDPSQPIYILELGSGSGRFAYHFLKKFHAAYSQSSIPQTSVQYIITDFTEQNLKYWQTHPSLQPYLANAQVDFACFDAESDHSITLSQSGVTLTADSLKNPLIVIANYVLDSIPQDVFHIENGQLFESQVTLSSSQAEPDLTDPELLQRLEISYTQAPITADYYDHPAFNDLLKHYQQTLTDTYLMFPSVAMKCLDRLRQMSGDRLLWLSGDKGYSREEDLLFRDEPSINLHGSFSLMVNYHAIGQYVQQQGGVFLTPPHRQNSLNLSASLFGASPQSHPETHLAFTQYMVQNSPDDFYALKQVMVTHSQSLSVQQFLSYLRLSGWDAKIFLDCFPGMIDKFDDLPSSLQEEVFWAVQNIWDIYYPIGEDRDLAFYLGMLLYSMKYFPEAIEYLQQSRQLYGDDPDTLYNMAMCYYGLRQLDQAQHLITQTLELSPKFERAKAMRIKIKSEANRLRSMNR